MIGEAIANQEARWSVEARRRAELRKILTPAQTTRLLVVLPAFERELQRQHRRAIVRRAAPRTPDLDDDDLVEVDGDDLVEDDAAPPRRDRRRGTRLDDDEPPWPRRG